MTHNGPIVRNTGVTHSDRQMTKKLPPQIGRAHV